MKVISQPYHLRVLILPDPTVKYYFRIVGRISPGLVLPFLLKRIFTPAQPSIRDSHQQILEQGRTLSVTLPASGGRSALNIQAYSWSPVPQKSQGKTVLLMHGWGRNALDFYKAIPELLKAGYDVLAFDAPAHGRSDGEQSTMLDFSDALQAVMDQIMVPYAIVAHSVGCVAAVSALATGKYPVQKLVLNAPTVNLKSFVDHQLDGLEISGGLRKLFHQQAPATLGFDLAEQSLTQYVGKLSQHQVLVLFDASDKTVSDKDVVAYLAKEPHFKSRATIGYGHRKMMRSMSVTNLIVQFLNG